MGNGTIPRVTEQLSMVILFYGDLTAASDFLKDLPHAAANIVKIQLGKLGFAHLKKLNGSTNDPGDCNIPSPIMEIEVDT